jgi:hypothetical protein
MYKFTYLDRLGNDIEIKYFRCNTKKEAVKLARNLFAELCDNHIVKIKTRKLS